MQYKRRAKPKPLPEGWVVSEVFKWNGRAISVGSELSISGIRGRCLFVKHVKTTTSEYIDVIDNKQHFRSVHPERIRTVHRIMKTRENA